MAKSNILEALEGVVGTGMEEVEKVAEKPAADKRLDILKKIEADIDKQFSTKHSIIRLGDKVGVPLPSIPTNIPNLDYETIQCGGLPRGRIIEFFGPESSGKTTLALHTIGNEQKTGELCAFIDAEHALDPNWCSTLGVNVDDLIVSQPDSGEQALETAIALVKSRAVSLIVIDSVSALVPLAELKGEMGESHMGLQARLMSQGCRKLRGICDATGVTVIFINQIREKIGVMFGSPETTSGGRALRHYASLRLDIRRIAQVKDGDNIIGHRMRAKAVKNKVGSPLREAEFELMYDSGINVVGSWIEYGIVYGVVEKSGSWYSAGGERLGQGLLNATNALKANPDWLASIQKKILDKSMA